MSLTQDFKGKVEKETEELFENMEHFITDYDESKFKQYVLQKCQEAQEDKLYEVLAHCETFETARDCRHYIKDLLLKSHPPMTE
jgi:hypothetical protein